MTRHGYVGLIVLSLSAVLISGCKPDNKFVAPPPAEIAVAVPLQQDIVPSLEQTGNTVAFNTTDLVARVEGFLTSIDYSDGAYVKKGDLLFQIDPTIYAAKVKQAEADLAAAKSQRTLTETDYKRQGTLLNQNVSAQTTYDQAKAKWEAAVAAVDNDEASLSIAQANLGYTTVKAPYDGIVTRHLVSVGELVGTTTTKLASIVQLDPLYVTFNVSEQDILRIRANLDRRLTQEDLDKIPVDIGLMDEQGYPHRGRINYISPDIDTTTGTILVRGLFDNAKRDLLPGFFVRIRVPTAPKGKASLIVPNRIVSDDQAGKYLLVVNKDDIVEQRRVTTGQLLVGDMRAIESGLTAQDRVVLTTSGRAVPGAKVVPKQTTLQALPAAAPAK